MAHFYGTIQGSRGEAGGSFGTHLNELLARAIRDGLTIERESGR